MSPTIEDLVLRGDARGISALRAHLPERFVTEAARLLLDHPRRALIATGFYVAPAGAAETDGPPGAAALGEALEALGYAVTYLTDALCLSVVEAAAPAARVLVAPQQGRARSEAFTRDLLAREAPSAVVAVERCGVSEDGVYRSCRGEDITAHTACLDPLFELHPVSVAVGDGGNEIGMGALAGDIPGVSGLPRQPCVTAASRLVIGATSNAGAYGLVAALSQLTSRRLLPSPEAELSRLRRCVAAGAVDGITFARAPTVDGLPEDATDRLLEDLDALVSR